jgi:hypothetical protein
VYLTYIDDSDTKDKSEKWQVMAAVMIPDSAFTISEFMASFVIDRLIPSEKLDKFEEFHASELFGGYGVFEDIDQNIRLSAIESLLQMINTFSIPIAYGAVNLEGNYPFTSGNLISSVGERTSSWPCLPSQYGPKIFRCRTEVGLGEAPP